MKRKFQIGGTALFLLFLLGFLMLAAFIPDKQQSLTENRSLQQFPDWQAGTPEQFASQLSDYASDQFPARSYWIKLDTALSVAEGKWLVRGNYLVDGTWLFPKAAPVPAGNAQRLGQALQAFCARYSDVGVCYALAPYKTAALSELLPAYVDRDVPAQNRKLILGSLPEAENLMVCDLQALLQEASSPTQRETFFYHTDFHWNARGAAFCVELLLEQLHQRGLLPADPQILAELYSIEALQEKQYLGDLNRQLSYCLPTEEEISVIRPMADAGAWRYYLHPGDTRSVARSELIGAGEAKAAVSYNDIYTQNIGYYRVENDAALSDQAVLLFKDSFQNPTTDLFSILFRQVTVIDPRYYDESDSVDELMAEAQPDLVLFLFHESNASQELADLLG